MGMERFRREHSKQGRREKNEKLKNTEKSRNRKKRLNRLREQEERRYRYFGNKQKYDQEWKEKESSYWQGVYVQDIANYNEPTSNRRQE